MPSKKTTHPSEAPKGSKKRVLIVEDERPLAHALELKMSHEGFETHVELNGTDGLKAASENPYDVILLDLIMPGMDGFTLLQELKKKGVKTPIVVLSNLSQGEDKGKVTGLGVVDYFVKANTPIVDIIKRVKEIVK